MIKRYISTGGLRFTTDKLSELNSECNDARTSYEEQQKSIVDEVVRVARMRLNLKCWD